MTEQRMNQNFAVFNNHVNDASARAITLLDEFAPRWAKQIKKADEAGIMSIFTKRPTPATAAYTMLVTAFVNENRT